MDIYLCILYKIRIWIFIRVCESPPSGGKDAVGGTMPTNTTPATKDVGQKTF